VKASVDHSGTTGKVRLVPGTIITREYWDRMKTRPKLTGTSHATIHGFSTWLDKEDDAGTGGHRKAREAAERKAAKKALKDGRRGLTLPFGGKSQFYVNALIAEVVEECYQRRGVVAGNGRIVITFELDHVAGHDAVIGYDTRQVTVVVEPDGEVITAFPGFPDYPPGLLRRHT
jgi:hypothetical protein